MMPIAMAIIGDIFPPAERGKWQGLLVAVFGLSSIIGPTAGGWITDNWGWRWTFYVNMPIGAVALLVAILVLPAAGARRTHTIDYLGSAGPGRRRGAAAAGLLLGRHAVRLGLARRSSACWSWPWCMLTVFIVIEMRVPEPIITPALFKNSIFSISVLATFLLAAGMFGAIMYLPLFVQGVIGQLGHQFGRGADADDVRLHVQQHRGRPDPLAHRAATRSWPWPASPWPRSACSCSRAWTPARPTALVVRNMVIMGLGIGVLMSLFTIVVQNAFPIQQLGRGDVQPDLLPLHGQHHRHRRPGLGDDQPVPERPRRTTCRPR